MDLPARIVVRKIDGRFYDAETAAELFEEDLWGWRIAGIAFVVLDDSGQETTLVGGEPLLSGGDDVPSANGAIPHGMAEQGRERFGRSSPTSGVKRRILRATLVIIFVLCGMARNRFRGHPIGK